jgi:dihydroorotase (multifunctional complex type)
MAGLTIRGARWIDSRGRVQDGPLYVRDGRVRLTDPGTPSESVLDVPGGLVLPGGIDAHTHLREPGQEAKEGIANGSRAALAGGVVAVLDMPNDLPPTNSPERLAQKAALFRAKSRVHWGLHVQAPVEAAGRLGPHASSKIYLAKSSSLPALPSVEELRKVFSAHRRVAIHAEDERQFLPAAGLGARTHHLQRPRQAVLSALRSIETALGETPPAQRPRLVLCHVSTAEEVGWLRKMKDAGHDVWGETCPHYLLLTENDYLREGAWLKVNPPLRTDADVEAVRAGLAGGSIDFVSSDHAPHTRAEKAEEATAPSGIAGLEWYLPALLSLVDSGLLSLLRLVEVTSQNAARCYELKRGGPIEDGAWADLAVVSKRPDRPGREVVTRAGYRPYTRARLEWSVEATLVSGAPALADNAWAGPTRGEEIVA